MFYRILFLNAIPATSIIPVTDRIIIKTIHLRDRPFRHVVFMNITMQFHIVNLAILQSNEAKIKRSELIRDLSL